MNDKMKRLDEILEERKEQDLIIDACEARRSNSFDRCMKLLPHVKALALALEADYPQHASILNNFAESIEDFLVATGTLMDIVLEAAKTRQEAAEIMEDVYKWQCDQE